MNFFQRLSYLKKWYDNNHIVYLDSRKNLKDAFNKKYKNELKRYTEESKRLKKKRAVDISEEKTISYQDWVERNFQKLLKKLSQTIVEYQKQELLDNFENWIKDFAMLDYKFRVYSLELYYKVELVRYNAQFDAYIIALRQAHTSWILDEDKIYTSWMENHPLYKELQELEYQYDNLSDDTISSIHYAFNKIITPQNNYKKHSKEYKPSTIRKLTIAVKKPLPIKPHTPSYF